jgi:hypothetical protein
MKILEIAANQSQAHTLVEGIVAGAEPKQIIAAAQRRIGGCRRSAFAC